MKRQVGSDSSTPTRSFTTNVLCRTTSRAAHRQAADLDLRESGCLTANTRILRADTGAQVTFGELIRTGERPLVWSLDERAHGRAADDQWVLQRTQGGVQAAAGVGPRGGGDGEPSVHDACPLGSVGRVDDWRSPCGTATPRCIRADDPRGGEAI